MVEKFKCEICGCIFELSDEELDEIFKNGGEYPPSCCKCKECWRLYEALYLCETEEEEQEVFRAIKEHIKKYHSGKHK